MTKMTKTSKQASGCGCGCGGSKSSGGCCSGTTFPGRPISAGACDPCEEGSFVRPRFFAGQLLTEDDLEAINTYVVGKNRLHNSRLFGDGVVCGLEVVCGPCGGDTVVVRPGYALDCCGNDLVLGCERELDIGDMVSALREQNRPGHGCGDPCAEAAVKVPCVEVDPKGGGYVSAEKFRREVGKTRKVLPATGSTAEDMAPTDELPSEEKCKPPEEYCLYVRYDERQTEPTAPYPVGDDCGMGPCEATRVVEGVTFELRCKPHESREDDVLARIVRFLDRLSPDGRVMDDLRFLQYFARTAGNALRKLEDQQPPEVDRPRWQSMVDQLGTSSSSAARAELLAAFSLETGPVLLQRRGKSKGELDKLVSDADVERTHELLARAEEVLAEAPQAGHAFIEAGREALGLYGTFREKPPRYEDVQDPLARLYFQGWAHGPAIHRRIALAFQNVRTSAYRVVQSDANEPDCLARAELARLDARAILGRDAITLPDVAHAVQMARRLVAIVFGVIRDRTCMAALPPCPPCDDPAVLLACVKVVGCKVVEICNLERRFVLSPMAVRHWLPPLRWFGEVLEQLCCGGALADVDGKYHYNTAKQLFAVRALAETPGIGSLAQVASDFYSHAPHPSAIAQAFRPLVSLGDESATTVREGYVSRREMQSALEALKREIQGAG